MRSTASLFWREFYPAHCCEAFCQLPYVSIAGDACSDADSVSDASRTRWRALISSTVRELCNQLRANDQVLCVITLRLSPSITCGYLGITTNSGEYQCEMHCLDELFDENDTKRFALVTAEYMESSKTLQTQNWNSTSYLKAGMSVSVGHCRRSVQGRQRLRSYTEAFAAGRFDRLQRIVPAGFQWFARAKKIPELTHSIRVLVPMQSSVRAHLRSSLRSMVDLRSTL
jgi:hypothetical protein